MYLSAGKQEQGLTVMVFGSDGFGAITYRINYLNRINP